MKKIGIVGSGKIGGLVGKLLAKAGHAVVFSSRHPETLDGLVREAGKTASSGTVADAVKFGEVVLVSIPFGMVPEFAKEHGEGLRRKVVMETGNPYPARDGALAEEVLRSELGTGVWVAQWLPGSRVVRAFNSVWDQTLAREAHRKGPKVGVPLASDDPEAMETAAELVRDAGFDPVEVGRLAEARRFDVGTPVYNSNFSGDEVRKALGLT